MKTKSKRNWLIAATMLVMTATFLVWPMYHGQAQKKNNAADVRKNNGTDDDNYDQDSTKQKRKYHGNGESDEQIRIAEKQLQDAMQQVQAAMQQLQEVEMPKINETVANALKSVDFDNIKVQVDQAMKNVDMKNIQVEINKAMANVDVKNIKVQIDQAMKSIDWASMKKEIADGMKEMKNINKDAIENAMKEAKKEIENAKVEMGDAKIKLKKMKGMLDEMKKDGLINDTNHVNIEWKKGKLYIDGKQQPDNVSDKYRQYMDEDNSSIHIDNDKNDSDDL